jgi:hypothetical protein
MTNNQQQSSKSQQPEAGSQPLKTTDPRWKVNYLQVMRLKRKKKAAEEVEPDPEEGEE